ncbi:MAG: L-lactate permease [Propionibacteriaceae bacterium]|nr:L-lactate permease [Propionibacteriaceae bacterium]
MNPFVQPITPIGGDLLLSALVAAIPLLVLFVMLGVFKVPAWIASLTTVVLTAIIAIVGWQMPAITALSATAEGIFFGALQIMWILIAAVWMYQLTVKLGWDKVLRDLLRGISDDLRVLSILIAFCFGALLEALAGFGTPVAITAAMLVAAGMKPLKSAMVCMVANTAPVAFGAMGAPITALGTAAASTFGDGNYTATALAETFGAMAGRQSPFMACIVPLFLVFLVDGFRGLKDTWHIALSAGVVFAIFQFMASNWLNSYQITDVIASVACILAILGVLQIAKPNNPVLAVTDDSGEEQTAAMQTTGFARVWGAIAPYTVVVVLFSLSQIPALKTWLSTTLTVNFPWPGLQAGLFPKDADGKVIPQAADFCGIVTQAGFDANAVTSCNIGQVGLYSVISTGTILFIGGIITALIYRMNVGQAAGVFGATLVNLRFTIVTIASVLAVAYLMNGSGMTVSIGKALAGVGLAFAFVSPVLGWLGVAITGSDTSSNALFGGMQVAAAKAVWGASGLGLESTVPYEVIMATSNSTGGCMGKMVSPQSLSVACAAAGMVNQEGILFRKIVGWSLVLLIIFAILVTVQALVVPGIIPLPALPA